MDRNLESNAASGAPGHAGHTKAILSNLHHIREDESIKNGTVSRIGNSAVRRTASLADVA